MIRKIETQIQSITRRLEIWELNDEVRVYVVKNDDGCFIFYVPKKDNWSVTLKIVLEKEVIPFKSEWGLGTQELLVFSPNDLETVLLAFDREIANQK